MFRKITIVDKIRYTLIAMAIIALCVAGFIIVVYTPILNSIMKFLSPDLGMSDIEGFTRLILIYIFFFVVIVFCSFIIGLTLLNIYHIYLVLTNKCIFVHVYGDKYILTPFKDLSTYMEIKIYNVVRRGRQ